MKSSTMFFGKIFDSLLMFVFNIFAARLLGAKDYGTYVYLSTIIMFGSIRLKMGLDQGIAAIVPKYDDDHIKKSIISFSLAFIVVMSLSLTLLSIIFSDFISEFVLNNGSLSTYYVQMIPLLLFYALLQLSEGIFRTYGNIRDYVIAMNIIMPISILLVFLIGAFGFDIRTVQMLIISNYFGWILATLYILFIDSSYLCRALGLSGWPYRYLCCWLSD
jgi:O-antigen/teichoic acid export membrane protein